MATNNLSTVSGPTGVTGWTQVSTMADTSSCSVVWRKVAVAADAGKQIRISLSPTTKANLVVMVYRGTSRTNPVATFVHQSGGTGTTHATPIVGVPAGGAWVVSYWTHEDSSTTTLVAPSGVVVRSNSGQTGSGRIAGLIADSGAPVAAGSHGGLVARGVAAAWGSHVMTIVLAPG